MQLPTRRIEFPRRPLVMGIVNINNDSFSGDGSLVLSESLEKARTQIAEGADIIDVGAESARTNRGPVAIAEEKARFQGFLEAWPEVIASCSPRDEAQVWPPILSANTWRPEVAESCLQGGAEILNDMGGLHEDDNARLCAQFGACLLIMHNPGQVKVPATEQSYQDVMASLCDFFSERCDRALQAGLSPAQLILDPGIDFAKQKDDNLRLLREFHHLVERFPYPWLLPISRKTVIGEVLDQDDPQQRDPGSIALLAAGISRGAHIFRVHHVAAAWAANKTLDSLSA